MKELSEKEFAKIIIPGTLDINCEIKKGTMGPSAMDVTNFLTTTGIMTYDPGYTSTASCESQITYIDGDKGHLLHRGYKIEDLAQKCDFLEVVYLLFYGELPTKDELDLFNEKISEHTLLNERIYKIFAGFPCDAHPMSIIIGIFASLSAFYPQNEFSEDEDIDNACLMSVAKIVTIVAAVYKFHIGEHFAYPSKKLNYSENFLKMMFERPNEEYKIDKDFASAINMILILHADHEQNASTSTVRLAGSTGTNPFACIAAGLASLWGPAHGGANEAVIEMLKEIGDVSKVGEFIERVKRKENGVKLMGFGHRIYKNFDPRASVLKEEAKKITSSCGNSRVKKLLQIAQKLEEVALTDDYFISRKLYPNVDFYSGFILKAIGIPKIMFTPIFALSRVSGWISQWKEMLKTSNKIGRPRQLYTGLTERAFKPMKDR